MSILTWFAANGHWSVIMGSLFAVLGTLYVTYGYLNIKFLKTLTQGFVFGLIGGVAVTPGIGLFGISLFFLSSLFVSLHLVKVPSFSLASIIGLLIFGAIFGIIVGFIIGLKLDIAQRFDIPLKVATWGRNVLLVLGFYFIPESLLDAKASYILGIVIGALIGYIFYNIRITIGFLYSSIMGLVLTLLFGFLLNDPRTAIIGFLIGLLLGATRGQPEKLAIQPKLRARFTQQEIRFIISWARFIHGFIIGFVSGALTFAIIFGFFAISPATSAIFLMYGLAGGVAIGIMVGSTYGFGPAIISTTERLSERRLGQIGLILGATGILAMSLPPLFT